MPNPASEVIKIVDFNRGERLITLQFSDISGNEVKTIHTEANSIDVPINTLKSGVYAIRVIETGMMKKFIKL